METLFIDCLAADANGDYAAIAERGFDIAVGEVAVTNEETTALPDVDGEASEIMVLNWVPKEFR